MAQFWNQQKSSPPHSHLGAPRTSSPMASKTMAQNRKCAYSPCKSPSSWMEASGTQQMS